MKLSKADFLNRDALVHRVRKLLLLVSISVFCAGQRGDGADQYWRTDGATGGNWTSNSWSNPASPTGGTGWTNGNNAFFTADSTLTFATSTVGNVAVADSKTVTITAGGTLSLGAVRTFDIGAGALLEWRSQTVTANSAGGITKNGSGTLRLDALTFDTNMNGGFTLNEGTVVVSGGKAFGNGAMTINAGTVQSSGGNSYVVSSLTIGGNFTFTGTGNDSWGPNFVDIGSSTRTITNNTTSTATRTFSAAISGSGGVTFDGVGGSGGIVLSGSSSYNGATTVSQGKVTLEGGTTASATLKNTSGVAVTNGGTLLFSGAGSLNNKLNTAATVTLGGGTLNTGGLNGLDQTVGALTLTANSVIDFGSLASGSQSLRFAASNADWTGLTLSIWNWTAGVDHLYFGTSASGLDAAQLARISFYGGSGTGFLGTGGIASNGELSAIPEPSTVLAVAGLVGLIVGREYRRRICSNRVGAGAALLPT